MRLWFHKVRLRGRTPLLTRQGSLTSAQSHPEPRLTHYFTRSSHINVTLEFNPTCTAPVTFALYLKKMTAPISHVRTKSRGSKHPLPCKAQSRSMDSRSPCSSKRANFPSKEAQGLLGNAIMFRLG